MKTNITLWDRIVAVLLWLVFSSELDEFAEDFDEVGYTYQESTYLKIWRWYSPFTYVLILIWSFASLIDFIVYCLDINQRETKVLDMFSTEYRHSVKCYYPASASWWFLENTNKSEIKLK